MKNELIIFRYLIQLRLPIHMVECPQHPHTLPQIPTDHPQTDMILRGFIIFLYSTIYQ